MFTLEGEDTCVGGVGLFVRVFMSHVFCCTGNDGVSAVVDIFNVTAGTWSTAKLSHAATFLSATSLPNVGVTLFAGGYLVRSMARLYQRRLMLCFAQAPSPQLS